MVASYSAAKTVIFDLETGQSVLNLDSSSTYGKLTYWDPLIVHSVVYMYVYDITLHVCTN